MVNGKFKKIRDNYLLGFSV